MKTENIVFLVLTIALNWIFSTVITGYEIVMYIVFITPPIILIFSVFDKEGVWKEQVFQCAVVANVLCSVWIITKPFILL